VEAVVGTVADLFRDVHQQLRQELQGLDAEALNWKPGPETNSIAVLVVHLLASEEEILHVVRGLPSDRQREAEFHARVEDPADLSRRIDRADDALARHAPAITSEDLLAVRPHPRRPANTGLYWLLVNYGHAREHLAQLQLTKQLYLQRRAGVG